MLDVNLEPWLICGSIALIVLRPKDWQDIAFHCGKWVRLARAYQKDWIDYLDHHGAEKNEDARGIKKQSSGVLQTYHWPDMITGSTYCPKNMSQPPVY